MKAPPDPHEDGEYAEYVSHEEFRAGLPAGRLRLVVNPELARAYVGQRLHVMALSLPFIGIGMFLAVTGRTWLGAALVFAGVAFNRLTRSQAPKILVHLALRNPAVYRDVTQGGVMEVRRV